MCASHLCLINRIKIGFQLQQDCNFFLVSLVRNSHFFSSFCKDRERHIPYDITYMWNLK